MEPPRHIEAKILVVDDEEEAARLLKSFLEGERCQIELAYDGKSALKIIETFKPNCVLLDIKMPEINGIDALKMIKFRQPDVQVIMVTAFSNIKIAEECMRQGAFGYITKPVDLDYLLREIDGALKKREELIHKEKISKYRHSQEMEHLVDETKKYRSLASKLDDDLFNAYKFNIHLIELIDPEFSGHSKNVAWLCREIADLLSLPQLRLFELSGLYHDIGKLCLPSHIWKNPWEALTPPEKAVFKMFPVYSQELVQSQTHLFNLRAVLRHQCENVDGTGFPDQLPGFKIPLESKILAVANSFEEEMRRDLFVNMEQDLVEGHKALEILKRQENIKFDPAVIGALEQIYHKYKYKAPREVKLEIKRLKPKMVLSKNVFTNRGKLVLSKNTTITIHRIKYLKNIDRIESIETPLHVYEESI